VDSEVLMGILKKNGFPFTEDVNKARVLIINTCAFVEKAKQESIDAILELAAFKREANPKLDKKLIVAGCLSQRYTKELKKEIPEIDGIFGSADFTKIPAFLKNLPQEKKTSVSSIPQFLYDHKSSRSLITPSHYAYVKLQEGCMNNCSYCVIPKLRGPYRSRSFNSVIEEVKTLKEKSNVKEVNLIGQDTTLYGIDRYNEVRISDLIKEIAEIMKERWVRLLYTHPAHFSEELMDVIASEGSVCKYVDLPIQHINTKILKKMNRGLSKDFIVALIEKIRDKIPDVKIRTSVIVGFPGEGDKEFKELVSFIKEMKFERLGAFTYSREEGTKAYNFSLQVSEEEKEARYDTILKVQQDISLKNNLLLQGKTVKVLIDKKSPKDENVYYARTEMDAPEVDGICYVNSKKALKPGTFVNIRITDTLEYDLVGDCL